jgi:hypothetical protein
MINPIMHASVDVVVFSSKLYFVKVDVKACFDTIDQRKLLEILKKLVMEVRN